MDSVDPDPRSTHSFTQKLKRLLGADVDPCVSLLERDASSHTQITDALQKIEAHSPEGSRYQERGEISRGGQGQILRTWDDDLRRIIAKKVLLLQTTLAHAKPGDSGTIGRFLEEAQVTAQLEHPGVVPVHELGIDDRGQVYFTMRLVRGDDLREIFRRVHLGQDGWTLVRVLGVMHKACEALSFAHSRGVVHRDLKPANLMVGRFGEVYVMDWGLARVLDREDSRDLRFATASASDSLPISTQRDLAPGDDSDTSLRTRDGTVIGTPAYMPPEQAFGHLDQIGPRSDVYSFGAMLYHLLGGRMPYLAEGERVAANEVWRRVCSGPPAPLESLVSGLPAELVAICERAMQREPAARYTDMGALAEDLRAYLEDRVVRAHRTGALVEFTKWVRRNRSTAGLVTALLVVLATSGFALAWVRSKRHAADLRRLYEGMAAACVDSVEELWPIHPDKAPDLRDWLARARTTTGLLNQVEAERLAFESLHADAAREPDPDRLARMPDDFELRALETKRQAFQNYLALLREDQEGGLSEASIESELRFAEHNRAVLELELPYVEQAIALRRELLDELPSWRFVDEGLRSEHGRLRDFAADLELLSRAETGLIAVVERRLEQAESLAQRSLVEYSDAWREALESIADERACPLYGGLRVVPQLGLVPLGRDPGSGLWEFWHVSSGERPRPAQAGAGSRWQVRPETGIVMILVPGGTLWMGAQDNDSTGPNYLRPEPGVDSRLLAGEKWMAEVTVEPCFVSRYELTQAQWLRLTGEQPSEYWAGLSWIGVPRVTRTHPVETVSWNDATRALARWNLTLPTEAQWERAARAGTQTKYSSGDRMESLLGQVNFGDAQAQGGGLELDAWHGFDDGFPVHGPVDALQPNAWGFHGISGNVKEWCRDWYAASCERGRFLPGDGEHEPVHSQIKAYRGGSFYSTPGELRVSRRHGRPPVNTTNDLGLRPARALDPGSPAVPSTPPFPPDSKD